jgi:hypothetical protein
VVGDVACTGAGGGGTRLVCQVCGHVVHYTDADLLVFVRTGFPRCCGETMALARESPDPPRPGGSKKDSGLDA